MLIIQNKLYKMVDIFADCLILSNLNHSAMHFQKANHSFFYNSEHFLWNCLQAKHDFLKGLLGFLKPMKMTDMRFSTNTAINCCFGGKLLSHRFYFVEHCFYK